MKARSVILPLLFGVSVLPARAEVGLIHPGPAAGRIIVYSLPPDPDPHFLWSFLIDLDPATTLNPGGDLLGDGEPSFGIGEAGASPPPTVTWARQMAPGNHDPVFSQFLNGAWGAPVVIAAHPGDDRDPVWRQDAAGNVHSAWWRAGAGGSDGEVLYAFRPQGSGSFNVPERVSQPGEAARNGTMALLPSGEVWIGYETDPALGWKHVVVSSKPSPQSPFQIQIIATIPYLQPILPEIRSRNGHTWLTWIDSAQRVGYSERLGSGWTAPSYEPFAGIEDAARARMTIQARVLSP